MAGKPIRSPAYPSMSLEDAVGAVEKIEAQYRGSPVDREDGAKLLGYSGATGPANKALAALASYGLVERAGKGMMRVTSRARSIIHPDNDADRNEELAQAALEPKLFKELRDRFEDIAVPPMDGVVTYLNREGFNPTAVGPAAKAFINTMQFIQSRGESESHVPDDSVDAELGPPGKAFGGAAVGDFVQWESQGALQFETPQRVRAVSEDGNWIAVEGSETGIPMNQITVEQTAPPKPPAFPSEAPSFENPTAAKGFSEWFRAKVGADKLVTINFKGEGEIGPKEIEKMIRVLEAQKLALED
ncbi:hypothetical protein [uncultured Tateyamaria sp.]|uniref:hypothetical protein n=1 Tax=uncultured Tateyamaria sp. TaxID=455651 RepID=UPI0026360122|nr:hypothetical protein [uncultured Tateyamaria sp.]